jgi:hypothetical protein
MLAGSNKTNVLMDPSERVWHSDALRYARADCLAVIEKELL